MSRPDRRLVLAVGAVAAAAGLGAAWWQNRASPAAASSAGMPPQAPGGSAHPLWSLHLPRPGGGEVALSELRGKPLLVNFWATWCPPCIREMPEIDRFAKQFGPNGWQVLGIAVDQDKPVRDFLARNPIAYPVVLAGFEGVALSRQLGNDNGALPFTVALDASGNVVQRHLGETRYEMLAGWAEAARSRR